MGFYGGFRVHSEGKRGKKNGNLGNCREIHIYIDASNMENHHCKGISNGKNPFIRFSSLMDSSQFDSPSISNFPFFSSVNFFCFFAFSTFLTFFMLYVGIRSYDLNLRYLIGKWKICSARIELSVASP